MDSVLRENKGKVFIMQFDIEVEMHKGLSSSRHLDEAPAFVDTPVRREFLQQNVRWHLDVKCVS